MVILWPSLSASPRIRLTFRACLKLGRGRLARREEEAEPQRSVVDNQRRQRALPSKTEPLPIFRQALSQFREDTLWNLVSFRTVEVIDMKPAQLKLLSQLCFVLGFASIIGSIAIWFLTGGQAIDTQAHGERFGIFVGLWAPTFFILSNRFERFSEKAA
ncbi:MAG: hypothetical protein RLZZ582_1705 [Verrucomicrobiota bacterium]